jgi:hypothetical protein
MDVRKNNPDPDVTEINLETNSPADKFSRLDSRVFFGCEDFEPEVKEEEKNKKKWLKNSLEEIFDKMQKYF